VNIFAYASDPQQISVLSRTFHLNFKDFPAPKSLFSTFQVLEILQKKFRLSRRRGNPEYYLASVFNMA